MGKINIHYNTDHHLWWIVIDGVECKGSEYLEANYLLILATENFHTPTNYYNLLVQPWK